MESMLQRIKSDPLTVLQTPEMKGKVTTDMLVCMSVCGVGYAVVVTATIFITVMFWALPVVYPEPEELRSRSLILMFFVVNIVVNFILVATKRSYYNPGASSDDLPDHSWRRCPDCNQDTPPRAHHCPLCRKCILRRDHHCFFTGSCVGFENQRFYLVFCFYCGIGCAFCFYVMQQFIVLTYLQDESISFVHYLLPVAAIECVFRYISIDLFYYIFVCYLCTFSSFGSISIFCWQFCLAAFGTTMYEYNKGNWSYRKGFLHNLRSVFGPWWGLNFILPLVCVKTPGNGVDWNVTKIL